SVRLFGVDVRPSDGTIFAVGLDSNLYTINAVTGAVTLIGATGIGQTTALAIQPGTETLFAADGITGKFYSVNATTGAGTLIGTGSAIKGFAFSAGGSLYGFADDNSGGLSSVNPATGASTLIGGSLPGLTEEDSTFLNGVMYHAEFNG